MPRFSKKIILLSLLIISVIGFLRFNQPKPILRVEHIDILDRRKQYNTFARLNPKSGQSLEANCTAYFSSFDRIKRPLLEEQASFQHNGLLFKKAKWLKEEARKYRKERRQKKLKPEDGYEQKLLEKYYKKCEEHSIYEEGFVADMAHMRAFGKCFLDNKQHLGRQTRLCQQASTELFPFLLGELPRVEVMDEGSRSPKPDSRSCFINQLMRKGHGSGIVIPILPSYSRSQQLVRSIRLIKVLRAINNTLPIEIVLMDDSPVRKDLKMDIILAATKNETRLPTSFLKHMAKNPDGSPVYPEQEIRFVYLERAIDKRFYAMSDTLMMTLAPLLSSFEKAAVMTTRTIPLMRNLEELLLNSDLQTHGTKFFRGRAVQAHKLTRFPAGYFETNDLVNNIANVGEYEHTMFGLNRSHDVYSKRIKHEGYSQLIDPTFFLINKRVALPGLLISASLQYYTVIGSKYDFLGDNHEGLWLGQDLAGNVDFVDFNAHFAVGAGILTPQDNLKHKGPSQELCSSSWAQLSDRDDQSLVYVTTHQIENKVLPGFDMALKEKFSVEKDSGNPSDLMVDDTIYRNKLRKNPLRIESILRPVAVGDRKFNRDGLADLPWIQYDRFGALDDYWCAYDVVGSVELPARGLVTELSEEWQKWYNAIIEVWLLSSHQQSSSLVLYE